jgi:hypothetical protein
MGFESSAMQWPFSKGLSAKAWLGCIQLNIVMAVSGTAMTKEK